MKFEWDINKAALNIRNHDGIDFDDAEETFYDEFALDEYDAAHSELGEQRFNRIGLARKGILFVVYAVRGGGENEVIRIISARHAEKAEEESYRLSRKGYE